MNARVAAVEPSSRVLKAAAACEEAASHKSRRGGIIVSGPVTRRGRQAR
jgi:hypothetical protein